MKTTQAKGIVAGLTSGALWGFVFVVPKILPQVPATLIACGRFAFYGFVSLLALAWAWRRGTAFKALVSRKALRQAALFALAGNSLYYFFLVLGIRYAGVTASSLIIGLLPVTVALAGNRWRVDARLAPSLSLIVAGIVLVNASLFRGGAMGRAENPGPGVACLLISLALWTWYAHANARFLKANPRISGSLWASLTGVFTLVFSPVLVLALTGPAATVQAFADLSASGGLGSYLLWSAAMGLGASWVALWFWNITAHTLPTVLSGQLIASETVFALLYGFLWERRGPTALEAGAIILLVSGVLLAVGGGGRPHRRS